MTPTAIRFKRFFSVDSPKAIKANQYGYLNAINYMAPYDSAGVGNLCVDSTPGCRELCLGRESGQAAMVSRATGTNAVRDSRERKTRYYMGERQAFMREMLLHIARNARLAVRLGLTLAVRPNGSTDVAWEGMRLFIDAELAAELSRISGLTVTVGLHNVFSAFPSIQFLDYTKSPRRMKRQLPANYDLTFSRSESNEADCLEVLAAGRNVAIVFGNGLPASWHGYRVIDGDEHDLRHLDPRGVVVGLTPKGLKAKRSTSGFVLRDYAIAA